MAGHKQTGPRFPLLQTEPRTVPAPAPVRPRPTGSCSAPATARPRPADPRRSLRPSHLPRAPPPRYGRAGELGSRSRVSTTRISRTESLTPGTAETRDGAGTAAAGSRDNLPPRFRGCHFHFLFRRGCSGPPPDRQAARERREWAEISAAGGAPSREKWVPPRGLCGVAPCPPDQACLISSVALCGFALVSPALIRPTRGSSPLPIPGPILSPRVMLPDCCRGHWSTNRARAAREETGRG